MSKCTARNVDFLKGLVKCKKSKRNYLIDGATKDNIHSLTEIAHNTLKGNIRYKKSALKTLRKYREHIRKIAKKCCSIKKKKQILQQHGGFLPLLIEPLLAAVVGGISSNIVNSLLE